MIFSGTQKNETSGGTYVTIKDLSGTEYYTISSKNDAYAKLSPLTSSFSFDFHINAPKIENDNQVIYQKTSGSIANNITIALSSSADITKCTSSDKRGSPKYALSGEDCFVDTDEEGIEIPNSYLGSCRRYAPKNKWLKFLRK